MAHSSKNAVAIVSDRKARACAALFEHLPLAVALLDHDQNILESNDAFARTFGEPAGQKCYAIYKHRSRPCESCPVERVFAEKTDRPSLSEEKGVDRNGSEIVFQLQTVPIRGEGGEVAFVLAVSTDITRQLQLKKELQQTERLASVGLTVASLAHTLKNILTGLEGGLYAVSSGLERDDMERVKSGWGMVQRYIEQVSTIVRNLLNYSKVMEPKRCLVDPRGLLEGLVSFFADEAKRAGIRLELNIVEGVSELLLDPDLIHACLANLVANALDACMWDPDLDRTHQITVSAIPRTEGGVIFEVVDNGKGIAEEDQKKIMSTLFTTKGIRGTGLGLLLTRKAVQEHGGAITFTSIPGQGTTFRIAIPALESGRKGPGRRVGAA